MPTMSTAEPTPPPDPLQDYDEHGMDMMQQQGYYLFECGNLPDEDILAIETTVGRENLYGHVESDREATLNCCNEWESHEAEWSKIILRGSSVSRSLYAERLDTYKL
jgi:hypothetical protein